VTWPGERRMAWQRVEAEERGVSGRASGRDGSRTGWDKEWGARALSRIVPVYGSIRSGRIRPYSIIIVKIITPA
jgi:hypothetical protein